MQKNWPGCFLKIRYKPTWRSLWFRSWRRRGGSTTPHTTPTRWRSRRRRGSCGRGTECTIFFTKSSAENPATRKGIPFMRCCARPTRKRIPSWSRVRRNVQTDVAKFGRASVAAYKPTLCTPNYKPTFRSWRLDRDASVCTAVSVGVAEARQGRPRRGSERGERCAPQEQYNNRNHYYRSSTPATPPKSQRALPLPTPNPHIPSHSHPRKISKMRNPFHFLQKKTCRRLGSGGGGVGGSVGGPSGRTLSGRQTIDLVTPTIDRCYAIKDLPVQQPPHHRERCRYPSTIPI